MPKVLVLLATYNGRRWLPEQCETILNQTGVEVRLLASDDASSDHSRGFLDELQSRDARVAVLPETARAGSAGRNFYRLIRDADAIGYDFVAFADQDDTWYADKLERACAALHRAGAGGYSSAVRAVYADGRTHLLRQSPRTTSVDFLFEGAGQGCTFVMTRELFCRAQGAVRGTWDEVCQVHHHDWMLYALCRSWKLGWYFDPVPSMDYRQHSGNELGGRGSFAGISKRWGMLRSGWYLKQVDAVAGVIVGTGGAASIADFLQRRPPTHTLSKRAIWVTMLLRVGRRKPADRLVLGVAALLGYV